MMQVLAPSDTEVGSTPFRLRFVGYSTNYRELNASTVNTVANLNFLRAPRVQLSERGEGMFRLSASLLYVGELKGGEPDGNGVVYDLATRIAVYEGSFKNGVYSGRGKRYARGQLIEEGDFANGLLTSGVRHLPNGLLQCGAFVNDELCGLGRLVFPNGFFVSGYFSPGNQAANLSNQLFLAAIPSAKNAKKFAIGGVPLKGASFFFEQGVFIADHDSFGYLFYYNGDVFVGEVAGTTPMNGVMYKFTGVEFVKMTVGSKGLETRYKEPKIHVEEEFKYFELIWSVCWRL